MSQSRKAKLSQQESTHEVIAHNVTSPECLSGALLTICQDLDHKHMTDMVLELKKQTAAINADDLSRAESMLISHAHSLDGLFARLAGQALTTKSLSAMELYMRLALKCQNQARATLQTLGEIKAPKQVAFVRQANIGNQVQVNNGSNLANTRTRKTQKAPNELLEVGHGERLDTRAPSSAGGADPEMAPVGTKHRAYKRRG